MVCRQVQRRNMSGCVGGSPGASWLPAWSADKITERRNGSGYISGSPGAFWIPASSADKRRDGTILAGRFVWRFLATSMVCRQTERRIGSLPLSSVVLTHPSWSQSLFTWLFLATSNQHGKRRDRMGLASLLLRQTERGNGSGCAVRLAASSLSLSLSAGSSGVV